jgi:flagellar operon protein
MDLQKIGGNSALGGDQLKQRVQASRGTGVSFADLLKDKVQPQELKFSAHAESRIKSRGIEMTPEVKEKLNKAVSDVAKKGGKDALVLLNNNAFIVNVPNRTVVTAMDSENLNNNIFTNIDSATVVS